MALQAGLAAHLATGATTLCRCWRVARRDGVVLGFTDHDEGLSFDGMGFLPDDGLSAKALEQTTGLAVDNSEALGVLSHDGIAEADVLAGRFDGAAVLCWLVNWADTAQRQLLFRGTLGEIARHGPAFRAELRGLTEALNQPQGQVYHARCSAVLGDAACRFDTALAGYSAEVPVAGLEEGTRMRLPGLEAFEDGWFRRGRVIVLSGAAEGAVAVVKNDRQGAGARMVELWERVAGLADGDTLRLEAGCDKRTETCRFKFLNLDNFRGFPHLPGEDWLMAYPVRAGVNDGGSRG